MSRDWSTARRFGRTMQDLHLLQEAEPTQLGGDDVLFVLKTDEINADAQPKKVTVSGLAVATTPFITISGGGAGTPGPSGADGLSAYEIAVDNGFVGTESQWLASLVGPSGVVGPSGAVGPSGEPGSPGTAGVNGKILQVIQTLKTDTWSTSSANWETVTGLSGTITPSSTANKVLIICRFTNSKSLFGVGDFFRLVRGATPIFIGDAAGSRGRSSSSTHYVQYYGHIGETITYIDSPATDQPVTYALQGFAAQGTMTLYVGRSGFDDDNGYYSRTPSSLILMEIEG